MASQLELKMNSGLKLTGENNHGELIGNQNGSVAAESSELKLHNNRNFDALIQNCKVEASNCENSKLVGTNNTFVLSADRNSVIKGADNEVTMEANRNTKIDVKNCRLNLFRNANVDITGGKHNVYGKDNINLQVTGIGSRLNITGTRNHQITSGTMDELQGKHSVEIRSNYSETQPRRSRILSSLIQRVWPTPEATPQRSDDDPQPNYKIGSTSEISINGGNYKIGSFNFEMNQVRDKVHVSFDKNVLHNQPLSNYTNVTGISIPGIQGETLEFSAKNIVARETDGNRLILEMEANSNPGRFG